MSEYTHERRAGDRRGRLRRKSDKAKEEVLKKGVLHPNPIMRPARRVFVAILFLLICLAITLSYLGLQSWTKSIQRDACNRANEVRRESNARIPSHQLDAKNLTIFLGAITHTRIIEARAWDNLNKIIVKNTPAKAKKNPAFIKYEENIVLLVNAYKLAIVRDAQVRANESKLHFDYLPIVNCKKVV